MGRSCNAYMLAAHISRVRVRAVVSNAECSRYWFVGISCTATYLSCVVAIYLDVLRCDMWFVYACSAVGTDIRYLCFEFDESQWVEMYHCGLMARYLLEYLTESSTSILHFVGRDIRVLVE